ncbi:MAG: methyl-accepting chemotaxis protein [Bosea sp. (in: a-proteobacteria)]|uniref:methyl-accepting chemotaxis protein n=1 Tax=Bosea sp. (in: a-proteobacteria) TaxID=1871050 RepID=UPI002735F190|nr:methyl-accepting chemotaxis protein [Bosea sp. (in: a-proteobacteria)]MDP3602829.1 methyl-accepting chemotaxis protein [Bosea sp. (in: a-proteobacteria)]
MVSLKTRFALLCLFLAFITSAVAGIGIHSSSRMGSAIDDLANSATAIRNHTIGDMLHDGLRADVYAALIRSDAGQDGAETIAETRAHAQEFSERIAATKAIVSSPQTLARLQALDEPLKSYITQAVTLVELAFRDRQAALAGMPLFDERFEALETSMKEAGDALEAEALAAQTGAGSARQLAAGVAIAGLIIALLTAMGLYAAVLRSIIRPIAEIVATMRQRGSDAMAAVIPHRDRRDEIGEMARTIGSYQDVLAGRAAEEQQRRDEDLRASQRQAEAFAETAQQIRRAVDAAVHGDFSQRVDLGAQQGEMTALVTGINQINVAIDGATTTFADILEAIADGDLTRSVSADYSGKLGSVSASINGMVEKLAMTVSVIKQTAREVAAAAEEIKAGAENLSTRTEEQASSLEETAATTEQLAASVKASANASRQAVDLAENATRVARNGGAIVTDAIGAMNRIEQASGKITDITSVIDGIAFQTNLLALNAAVEAARAGDAGKGFAVVASEVRALAQQSADAAKSISGLINDTTQEVAAGVKLVRSAGEVLGEIVEATQKVAGTVTEVAAASGEQSNGIDEMSQTVVRMDEMTQQNAALAEESAASAVLLGRKIAELDALVAAFRTAGVARAAVRPAQAEPLRLAG